MNPGDIFRSLAHKYKAVLRSKMKTYYSQDGQDYYITNKIFNRKRDGIFVEIGANDGISFSNTYYMERELGWKGICIEPHPGSFQRLTKNRNCILVNGAISSRTDTAAFLRIDGYAEMLSGLVETYEKDHLERVEHDLKIEGGKKEEIQVPCYKLDDILYSNKILAIDYLSIDTEGGEYEILSSVDFGRVEVKVISVEVRGDSVEYDELLMNQGYRKVRVLGADHIYLRTTD